MNFLEFIFKLLWQFISFEPGRFAEIKEKASAWRLKVVAEAKLSDEVQEKKWYHKLIKHDDEWYVQVALAIAFLFAFKSVRTWLMSDPVDDGDDDDGSDGDDDVVENKAANLRAAPSQWKF